MRKALWLIQTLILAACCARAQNAPAIPDLPPLVLDDFSSGIRGQIQEAYADVRAHPDDATANHLMQRWTRNVATPTVWAAMQRQQGRFDVRAALPLVSCPTIARS